METVLQVRMDKKLRDKVEKLYNDMGLTFAAAVRLFANQSLVEKGLPFIVSKKKSIGGIFSKYADVSKWDDEKNAFEKAMVEKYGTND